MKTFIRLAFVMVLAPALNAQGPTRAAMGLQPNAGPPTGGAPAPEMAPPPRPDAAAMLLAHTGELKLADAQVTRLAAIARRTADRRKAMHATMDSMVNANRPAPPTNGAPPSPGMRQGPPPAARAQMEKMHDAEHVDLRDALAVLTPDLLAQSWEMMMSRAGRRGGPPMMGGGAPGAPGGRMGGGPPHPPGDSL